jgi:VRR-NUC domain
MARRRRNIFAPREGLIQQAVLSHWRAFGLPDTLVAAIPNARAAGQAGLTKGLFDLLVIAPKLGVGFIELKTETGRLSPDQEAFKLALIRAGVAYAICRGRDEPIRALEDWNVVRRQRAAA